MPRTKKQIGWTGFSCAQNESIAAKQRQRELLRPAVAAVCEALEQRRLLAGQGLFGEYFDSPSETQWTSPATRRHDPQIDFEWSSGKMIDGIGTSGAVQWTGHLQVPTAGNYTFFAETDDGVRLWIDGNLIIDDWTEGAGERSSSAISLSAGQHAIKMQYFDTVLNAKAKLRWQGPGIGKQIIPASALTPGHATTLPAGWTASDIGANFTAGDEDYHPASGTFTIRGSGQDIGGTSDGFRYVRTSLNGDGEIIARLSSYGVTSDSNEVGLMLRDGDGANARFFGIFGSRHDRRQIYRSSTGGNATTSTLASGGNNNEGAQYWFKLTRAGNVFTSYWSSNGTTWTLGASQTITGMPTTLLAGLAVSAHSTSVLNIATFDNITVTGQPAQPPAAAPEITNVAAALAARTITLSIADTNSTETGLKIYRKQGSGGTYSLIDTFGPIAGSANYVDDDASLTAGTLYYYKVIPFNAAGDGPMSDEAPVTTPFAPAAPTAPAATAATLASIDLTWSHVGTGQSGFTIQRSTSSTFTNPTTFEVNNPASRSHTDSALTAGTTYYYRLRAKNGWDASTWTASVSATTPQAPAVPVPLVKLELNENTGSTVANAGSIGGSLTRTTPTPAWSTNTPSGTGGASALDFGTSTGNYGVDSAAIIPQLGGLAKFTISGWLNNRSSSEGPGGNRVVTWTKGYFSGSSAPGVDLVYRSDGSLHLGVDSWVDSSAARSSSGKVTTSSSASASNWKFFAVTYDGTLTSNNVKFYFGDSANDAVLDVTRTLNQGAVSTDIGRLTLGHFNPATRSGATDRMFRGLIDGIQIHGDVLTLEQVKLVQEGVTNQPPVINNQTLGPVAENSPNGTVVGTVSATEPDAGQSLTYAITAGNTGNAFAINATTGQITVANASALNFETTPSVALTVQVTDNGTPSLSDTATVTINLSNVNEPPTNIALSNATVAENQVIGTTVGTFTATDPDAGNTFTYNLVSGTGSSDNASFTIQGNTLKTAASFNYEAKSSYSIRVRSTDQGGLWTEKVFTIGVTNVNEAPTAGAVNKTVNEDATLTFAVADFNSAFNDPDAGSALSKIRIESLPTQGALRLNGVAVAISQEVTAAQLPNLTYTPNANYFGSDSFTYKASDGGLWSASAAVVNLTVNAINDAPSFTKGADQSVTANAGPQSVTNWATNLSKGPANESAQSLSFEITGNTNTALFAAQPQVSATGALTYTPATDATGTATITLRIKDTGGTASGGVDVSPTQTFTITVEPPANQPPVINNQTLGPVAENSPNGTVVGTVSATEPDAGQGLTYVITAGNINNAFAINATTGQITVANASALNFETTPNFALTVQVADNGSPVLSDTATITINLTNTNEVPTDIILSATAIAENQPVGTIIGTFSTTDPDVGNTFSYSLVAGAGSVDNNSFTIQGNALKTAASFDYESASSYSIRIRSTDQDGLSYEKIFAINVTDVAEVNVPPTARNVSYNAPHDRLFVTDSDTGLLAFNSDPNGDMMTAAVVSGPSHGTLNLNADGTFSYEPDAGYVGTDSFTYTLNDGSGDSNEATVTLNISNYTPQAGEAVFAVTPGGTLIINDAADGLSQFIYDPDGDALTFTVSSGVGTGTLTVNPDGTLTYVAPGGATGSTTFWYRADDGITPSESARATIYFLEAGIAAVPDSYRVRSDRTLSVNADQGVLVNDRHRDGGTLNASLSWGPSHGSAQLNADGSFTYTPSSGYAGTDSFGYTSNDGSGNYASTAVTVLVVNTAPLPAADVYDARSNRQLAVSAIEGVLANDTDAEGHTPVAHLSRNAVHGSVQLNADGSFTYDPESGFVGTDTFTYYASDGLSSEPVTVTVVVSNVAPVGVADAYAVAPNTSLVIAANEGVLVNDLDVDGDPLNVSIVRPPEWGYLSLNADGSFSYTPYSGYVGSDSFVYRASDGTASTGDIVVNIAVGGLEPIAVADRYNASHGRTLFVDAADGVLVNDVAAMPGAVLAAQLVTQAHHGTVSLQADGSFTYNPHQGFRGTDSFTYRATDGGQAGAAVTVTIDVGNADPVPGDDAYTLSEDGMLHVDGSGVLTNDSDADGDSLSAAVVSGPAHGTLNLNVSGSFTYTPDPNFNGIDEFTYSVSDGIASSVARARITVQAVNDAPTAVASTHQVRIDHALTTAAPGVLAGASDVEGAVLAATLEAGPSHGTLDLQADGSFTYTPNAGYAGTDTFSFRATDGITSSAPVTVVVNVTNAPPTVHAGSYTVSSGTAFTASALGGLLGFASDLDGDSLTVELVSQPSHGTINVNADGSFSYLPASGFSGIDAFSYRVNDGRTTSGTATITLHVTGQSIIARPNTYYGLHDRALVVPATLGLLYNDHDTAAGAIVAELVTNPANGSLTFNGDGSFTYSPDVHFKGTDSFTYRATTSDGLRLSDTVNVDINVTNSVPVAHADSYSVKHGESLTVTVEAGLMVNDYDIDGDALTVEIVDGPTHGQLTQLTNGGFTYNSDAGYVGSDGFTYRLNDGVDYSEPVFVGIDVRNTAPTAVRNSFRVQRGQALSGNVLLNDYDTEDTDLDVTLVDDVSHGTLMLQSDGSFEYTPEPDYTGPDSFSYRLNDGAASGSTIGVTIDVFNARPIANDDYFAGKANTSISGNVITGSDRDPDGGENGQLAVHLAPGHSPDPRGGWQTAQGRISSFNENTGDFTYEPNENYVGEDTFSYYLTDGSLISSVATVHLEVRDHAPHALGGQFTVAHGHTLEATLSDWDPDNTLGSNNLTYTLIRQDNPSAGTLELAPNGAITFVPAQNFVGRLSFEYSVSDNIKSVKGTCTIDVTNIAPLAIDDAYETQGGTAISGNVLTDAAGRDILGDDDAVTVVLVSGPSNHDGTFTLNPDGSFTYQPRPNHYGVDQFTYRVRDGAPENEASVATVRIAVLRGLLVAIDDSFSTASGQPLNANLLVNDNQASSPDGTLVSINGQSVPLVGEIQLSHGRLTSADALGNFTYVPDPGFTGAETFSYTIEADEITTSATVTIKVTVSAPSLVNGSMSATEDQWTPVDLESLLSNASDADGTLTIANLEWTPPRYGRIEWREGQWMYLPDANFNGTDFFRYTVKDSSGLRSESKKVTIDIIAVDDATSARDDVVATMEDTPITIDVIENDIDVDDKSNVTISVTQPIHGTSEVIDNRVVYTPAPNWHNTIGDTFSYTVQSADGSQSTATVKVEVHPVNDPATINDDTLIVNEDSSGSINVLANDTDADKNDGAMQARWIRITSQPAHGKATIDSSGNVSYRPDANYNGDDSFTYEAYDEQWSGGTGTVNVTVTPVNDRPVLSLDEWIVIPWEEGASGSVNVLEGAMDPDGDSLSIIAVRASEGGAAYYSGGEITYTLEDIDLAYEPSWVEFDVSDGNGGVVTGTVEVHGRHLFTGGTDQPRSVELHWGNHAFWYSGSTFLNAWVSGGSVEVHFSATSVSITSLDDNVKTVVVGGSGTGTLAVSWSDANDDDSLSVSFTKVGSVDFVGDLHVSASEEISGNITGRDVAAYIDDSYFGRSGRMSGSITASRDVLDVYANVIDATIHADGNVDFVYADRIIGDITAGGDIGTVRGDDGVYGDITAAGDIDVIAGGSGSGGYARLGDVDAEIAAGGRIGSISATRHIKGSATAGNGISNMSAGQDMTTTIVATGGDVGDISIHGNGNITVTAASGDVASVAADGNLEGNVTASGRINHVSAGRSLDMAINAGEGGIGTIRGGTEVKGDISSAGVISQIVSEHGSINSAVSAAGNIGYVDVPTGVRYGISAALDITGNVSTQGDLHLYAAGRKATGNVDVTGTIFRASSMMDFASVVTVQKDVHTILVERDLTAIITARDNINSVTGRRTVDSTITAEQGTIGSVTAGETSQSQGLLTGTITAGTNIGSIRSIQGKGHPAGAPASNSLVIHAQMGSIGPVEFDGGVTGTFKAMYDIGPIKIGEVNGGDFGGIVETAAGSIGPVTVHNGSMSAALISAGNIGAVQASEDVDGMIQAGGNVTSVAATYGDIASPIDAKGNIGSVTASAGSVTGAVTAQVNVGNVTAGANIDGAIRANSGSVGNVVVGTGTAGGSISGPITAGTDIAKVEARGSNTQYSASVSPEAGPQLDESEVLKRLLGAVDDDISPPPPVLDGLDGTTGGDISGDITAGGNIGEITGHGALGGAVKASGTLGGIWTGKDVSGAITAGAGAVSVTSWGKVTGDVTAPGGVTVTAAGDLTGELKSTAGSVTARSWGNLSGTIAAVNGATTWSLGDSTGDVTATNGRVRRFAWGKVGGEITHKTDTVLVAVNGMSNLRLTAYLLAGGVAGLAADVALNGLTFVGAINGNLLAYATGDANLDVSQGKSVTVITWKDATGTIKSDGTVSVMSLGNADLNVSGASEGNKPTAVAIESAAVSGTYHGDLVSIDATGAFDGTVTTTTGAKLRVHGSVDGEVTSDGVADVFASGDVGAAISGGKAALVTTWGSVTGAITSDAGVAVVEAFKDVQSEVKGKHRVEVVTWGSTNAAIDSSDGSVNIFAARDVSGPITAGKSIAVEAGEDVLGEIIGGKKAAAAGERYGVTVTAQGNVQGDVRLQSTGDIVVSATSIVGSGLIEASDGDASVEALQQLDKTVKAGRNALVYADSLASASVTATNGTASVTTQKAADVTVTAKTGASVDAGTTLSTTVTLTGPVTGSNVNLSAVNGITKADVTAPGATVDVFSGEDATVGLGTGDSAVGSASITAFGGLQGTVDASGDVAAYAGGSISSFNVTTTGADSAVSVTGTAVEATVNAGGQLSVTSFSTINGTYESGQNAEAASKSALLTARETIDASIRSYGTGSVEVVTPGTVAGSIDAGGQATVLGHGGVSATVNAGKDAIVSVSQVTAGTGTDGVSGQVTAGENASVFSSGKITGKVTAGDDAIVTAMGDITGGIATSRGDITATSFGAVSGGVIAAHSVAVVAEGVSGVITGTSGSVSVFSRTAIASTVTITAGADASVQSAGDIAAPITAGGSASVFSATNISGPITATGGAASVDAGDNVSATIVAGQDAVVAAIGNVTGDVTAGNDAFVTGFGDLTGKVTATRHASVSVKGIVGAEVTAGQNATLITLGDVVAAVEATHGRAVVTAAGEVSGDIVAGAGGADVYSGRDITGDINSGGGVTLAAWGDISNSITATGSVHASASAAMDVTVNAGGSVGLSSAQSLDAIVSAGGDVSLSAFDALAAEVDAGGMAVITGQADTDVSVDADGDVEVFSMGTLTADVTSSGADVSLTSADDATISVSAADDVVIDVLANLSATSITAGDYAQVSAWGTTFITALNADGGAFLFSGGALQGGMLVSSNGGLTINGGAGGTIISASAPRISIAVLESMHVGISDSGDVEIIVGQDVGGTIDSAGTVNITALGDHTALTHAGVDANVMTVGMLEGEVRADRDVRVGAYGGMSSSLTVDAGRNIVRVWSRGSIGGLFTAANAIGDVVSYGAVNAVFTAGLGSTGLSDYGWIGSIDAWGSIAGTANAATAIGRIVSGKAITIGASQQPALVSANDRSVFGSYPEDPDVSLAAMEAGIEGARREIAQYTQEVSITRAGLARQLAADRASLAEGNVLLSGEFATAESQATAEVEHALAGMNTDWITTQEQAGYLVGTVAHAATDIDRSLAHLQAYYTASNAQELAALTAQIEADGQRVTALAAAEELVLGIMLNSKSAERSSELLRLGFEQDNREMQWRVKATQVYADLPWYALDAGQVVLDVIGVFDPWGVADGINGAIHLARGNYLEAAQSFVSMVPGVGEMIGKGAKLGVNVGRALCWTRRIGDGVIGGYLAYQGYQEGDWTKLALGAGGLLRFLRASCFEAGTQVVVGVNGDGTFQLRNIEDLRVGDVVLTKDQYDPAGELVEGRVTQVFQTTAYGIHILELQDEETGNVETIRATAEHPFYVEGQGWIDAGQLSPGMRVQNPDGTWSVVQANTYEAREAGVTVYNFEVEGGHTYFVADDQGDVSAVWVHNICAGRHHFALRSLGSRMPYGHGSLTVLNEFRHTKLHRSLNEFLRGRTKLLANGRIVDMMPRRGNSGLRIQANFTSSERIAALDDFYRQYNRGEYYNKFRVELAAAINLGLWR